MPPLRSKGVNFSDSRRTEATDHASFSEEVRREERSLSYPEEMEVMYSDCMDVAWLCGSSLSSK